MKNKKIIEAKIKSSGYSLGCYNKDIENLSKKELTKVLEAVDFYDHTDIDVTINKKSYVVEVATVDSEKDFSLLSKQEYVSRYGE